MTLDDVFFFKNSANLNQLHPICSQCNNSDLISLRKQFQYKIVWKGRNYVFLYWTNTIYSKFVLRLLSFLNIPKEDNYKYSLQINGKILNSSFLFPVNGIKEDIYLIEDKSILF